MNASRVGNNGGADAMGCRMHDDRIGHCAPLGSQIET